MTPGTSAPSVLLSTWYNNNTPAKNRRHALTAIGVQIASLTGVSSNIVRVQDEPNYVPALVVTAAFGGVGFISVTLLGLWMVWENARRNRDQSVDLKVENEILRQGPTHPSFRWS
jgi:ABC-type nickel/cobalt efflux system permease component RcnA